MIMLANIQSEIITINVEEIDLIEFRYLQPMNGTFGFSKMKNFNVSLFRTI